MSTTNSDEEFWESLRRGGYDIYVAITNHDLEKMSLLQLKALVTKIILMDDKLDFVAMEELGHNYRQRVLESQQDSTKPPPQRERFVKRLTIVDNKIKMLAIGKEGGYFSCLSKVAYIIGHWNRLHSESVSGRIDPQIFGPQYHFMVNGRRPDDYLEKFIFKLCPEGQPTFDILNEEIKKWKTEIGWLEYTSRDEIIFDSNLDDLGIFY